MLDNDNSDRTAQHRGTECDYSHASQGTVGPLYFSIQIQLGRCTPLLIVLNIVILILEVPLEAFYQH